jgi:hypothetical protein
MRTAIARNFTGIVRAEINARTDAVIWNCFKFSSVGRSVAATGRAEVPIRKIGIVAAPKDVKPSKQRCACPRVHHLLANRFFVAASKARGAGDGALQTGG